MPALQAERIELRASAAVKQRLQDAVQSQHKNISEFLLDIGIVAANETLADRCHFLLNDADWALFQEALDRPVQTKPCLKKLLNEPRLLG